MTDDSSTGVLTLRLAASRFGLQPNWLKKEAAEGRVPCLQAGNRFLFDEATLSEALRIRDAGDQPANTNRPTVTICISMKNNATEDDVIYFHIPFEHAHIPSVGDKVSTWKTWSTVNNKEFDLNSNTITIDVYETHEFDDDTIQSLVEYAKKIGGRFSFDCDRNLSSKFPDDVLTPSELRHQQNIGVRPRQN